MFTKNIFKKICKSYFNGFQNYFNINTFCKKKLKWAIKKKYILQNRKSIDMFLYSVIFLCCIQVSALYCLACENSVCEDCVNGEHAQHPTDSLENIVDQQLAALQDRVDSAKNRCSHDAQHVILSTVK